MIAFDSKMFEVWTLKLSLKCEHFIEFQWYMFEVWSMKFEVWIVSLGRRSRQTHFKLQSSLSRIKGKLLNYDIKQSIEVWSINLFLKLNLDNQFQVIYIKSIKTRYPNFKIAFRYEHWRMKCENMSEIWFQRQNSIYYVRSLQSHVEFVCVRRKK